MTKIKTIELQYNESFTGKHKLFDRGFCIFGSTLVTIYDYLKGYLECLPFGGSYNHDANISYNGKYLIIYTGNETVMIKYNRLTKTETRFEVSEKISKKYGNVGIDSVTIDDDGYVAYLAKCKSNLYALVYKDDIYQITVTDGIGNIYSNLMLLNNVIFLRRMMQDATYKHTLFFNGNAIDVDTAKDMTNIPTLFRNSEGSWFIFSRNSTDVTKINSKNEISKFTLSEDIFHFNNVYAIKDNVVIISDTKVMDFNTTIAANKISKDNIVIQEHNVVMVVNTITCRVIKTNTKDLNLLDIPLCMSHNDIPFIYDGFTKKTLYSSNDITIYKYE